MKVGSAPPRPPGSRLLCALATGCVRRVASEQPLKQSVAAKDSHRQAAAPRRSAALADADPQLLVLDVPGHPGELLQRARPVYLSTNGRRWTYNHSLNAVS